MKSPGKSSSTSTATSDRLRQVYEWILEGASEEQIREAFAEMYPTAKKNTVGKVIEAALERILQAGARAPGEVAAFCVESTRELYRKMVEIGDYPGALRALRQLHELAGRQAPDLTDLSTPAAAVQVVDLGGKRNG